MAFDAITDDEYAATVDQVVACIDAEKHADNIVELDTTDASRGKILLTVLLLGRLLSCSNRYVMLRNAGQAMSGLPHHVWSHANTTIDVVAIYCFITDGTLTAVSSRDSVEKLCQNIHVLDSLRTQWRFIRHELSLRVLICAPIAMGNAWFKGFLGTAMLCHRITESPTPAVDILFTVIAHSVGFTSAVCFYAFQIKGLALTHQRIKNSLAHHPAYIAYHQKNWQWIYWNKFENGFLGLVNALASAVTVFIYKNSGTAQWSTEIVFVAMALANAIISFFDTTAPKHFYECIEHEKKMLDRKHALLLPQPNIKKTCYQQAIFYFLFGLMQCVCITNTLGTCFALSPGLIHPVLQLTGEKELKAVHPAIVWTGGVVLLYVSYLTFPRDSSMWVKKARDMVRGFLGTCWQKRSAVLSEREVVLINNVPI